MEQVYLFADWVTLFQLIQDSLHSGVVSLDSYMTLVSRIAALHVVYRESSESIHWFAQLTSLAPGILVGLRQSIPERTGETERLVCFLYGAVGEAEHKMFVSRYSTCMQWRRY